ncbi:MAG: hypothetical protein ACYCTB_10080 [bacterium]
MSETALALKIVEKEEDLTVVNLLDLAEKLSTKQSHVVAGLQNFLDVWKKATEQELGDRLDLVLLYANYFHSQEEGLYIMAKYFLVRGENTILRKYYGLYGTEDSDGYEKEYAEIKNPNSKYYHNAELSTDEFSKSRAINIARKLEQILKSYIEKLKERNKEYEELSTILNKF